MDTNQTNGFSASMARRVGLWGPLITGFVGMVLALNASLSDEYVGAGVCLAASALAFGVIVYASHVSRNEA